jgi:diamine N-acetyltransferase
MYFSKRLRLRAMERTDIPRFVEWLNDPEVTPGISIIYPMGSEDESRWFDGVMQTPLELHPLVIEIKDGKDWKPIGNCGFHNLDWRNASGEVGIFIGDKSQWNKGFGGEALHLLMKVGFETMNLHRIWLRVMADNERAVRCYEKLGYIHEGKFRDGEYHRGHYVDMLVMSMLRPEWKNEYNPGV